MNKTVLVIDDEQHIRDDLETFLHYEGFDVLTAKSLNEANQAIRKPIDCAIIDLNLGDGSSLIGGLNAFLYLLRQRPRVAAIILSAYPYENVRDMLARELTAINGYGGYILRVVQENYVYKGDGNYIDGVISKLKTLVGIQEDTHGQPKSPSFAGKEQVFNTYISGDVQNLAAGGSKFCQHAALDRNSVDELFNKMIAAIAQASSDSETITKLTTSVKEMQEAHGTEGFGCRYQSFMSLLADHMQVFGPLVAPYLSTLTQLIT